jgi:hypothetical protein
MPRASFVDSQGDFRIDSLLVNYMDVLRLEVSSPKLEEPEQVTVVLPLLEKEFNQRTIVVTSYQILCGWSCNRTFRRTPKVSTGDLGFYAKSVLTLKGSATSIPVL